MPPVIKFFPDDNKATLVLKYGHNSHEFLDHGATFDLPIDEENIELRIMITEQQRDWLEFSVLNNDS